MLLCKSRQFMFLQMVSLVMGDSRSEMGMRGEFVKFSGFSMGVSGHLAHPSCLCQKSSRVDSAGLSDAVEFQKRSRMSSATPRIVVKVDEHYTAAWNSLADNPLIAHLQVTPRKSH
jgi:hypothetical protein